MDWNLFLLIAKDFCFITHSFSPMRVSINTRVQNQSSSKMSRKSQDKLIACSRKLLLLLLYVIDRIYAFFLIAVLWSFAKKKSPCELKIMYLTLSDALLLCKRINKKWVSEFCSCFYTKSSYILCHYDEFIVDDKKVSSSCGNIVWLTIF